jgi:pyruvate kinase
LELLIMPIIESNDDAELANLCAEVVELRQAVESEGSTILEAWGEVAAPAQSHARAENLSRYVAARRRDLTSLQYRLAARGLSSLGRSEADVTAALDTLIVTLRRLCGQGKPTYPSESLTRSGAHSLDEETQLIFGPVREGAARTRVLATLPPEAAIDYAWVERLVAAGVNCARINCAHDDATAWKRMVDNIRQAEKKLGLSCRILMDLAGPKCRVQRVAAPDKHRITRGGQVRIVHRLDPADNRPQFTISLPVIVDQLELGSEVHFDDGKAAARVIGVDGGGATLEVYAAREKGARLKTAKGLNFPTTEVNTPALTQKDVRDLDFVAAHADLVGYSFVQRVEDVELLQDHLTVRRRGLSPLPIVLKVETPLAVRNLPKLILRSNAHNPTAVMIARGDLAVEIGFARLSEMQEELLWLCEAARTPVIWATQVLDQFVRDGVGNRAEMTDAAMGQGAECVMLNKGPHLAEGVAFLRDVLTRMERHHSKRFARYTPLHAWG